MSFRIISVLAVALAAVGLAACSSSSSTPSGNSSSSSSSNSNAAACFLMVSGGLGSEYMDAEGDDTGGVVSTLDFGAAP